MGHYTKMEKNIQNKHEFSDKIIVEGYLVCARGDEMPNQEIITVLSKIIKFKFLVFCSEWG